MSGALIRAAPYALAYGPRAIKRARLAYNVGRTAWNNRRTILNSVSRIRRAWRRYKRRKTRRARTHVGEAPGTGTCKTNTLNASALSTWDTRELNGVDLIVLARETASTDEINTRDRDVINLRGVRIYQQFRNLTTGTITVNWAVIASKTISDDVAPSQVDFFRSGGTARGMNFSTSLTNLQLHMSPINTDKWAVLCHKRFKLRRRGAAAGEYNMQGGDIRSSKKYIRINRQLRFKGPDQISEYAGQLWLVFWCDQWMAPSGTAVVTQAAQWAANYAIKFREPK